MVDEEQDWEIPLFSIGHGIGDSLYSFFFCYSAAAEAKSALDGSECLFNFLCLPICVQRWLVRSALGIRGNIWNDILSSCFLTPCVVNQMHQTAVRRGLFENSGPHNNIESYKSPSFSPSPRECFYSSACCCCANAEALELSMGMPFIMGCCCVVPCAASQLIRYQYRIRGADIADDVMLPGVLLGAGHLLSGITFGGSYISLLPYTIVTVSRSLREARLRKGGDARRYLAVRSGQGNVVTGGAASVKTTDAAALAVEFSPMAIKDL